ncbi:retrovirus-related pol polyprotein from transposon TNT 1-94 [Tanacetum coccineum]
MIRLALFTYLSDKMATSHQQVIADVGSETRLPMLEKGSYVSWASRFKNMLLAKKEQGIRVIDSIENGSFKLTEITDLTSLTDASKTRNQTYADFTGEELRYEADINAMNWILLGIPNDIYNSVDASGESLESVYNRFCTFINSMDRNNLTQNKIVVNTKFLSCLQPECKKYVTRARQSHKLSEVDYDLLFDFLTQNEPDVNALRAKRTARNYDPLALVANTYARPSSSQSSQQYYFTHPPSVQDYDDDYQGEIQGHVQDGRVDIQGKSSGYVGSSTRNVGRNVGNQAENVGNQGITVENGIDQTTVRNAENVQRNIQTTYNFGKATTIQCYNCNERGHYTRDCSKPRVRDSKYFKKHMLLVAKDEAGVHLDEEEMTSCLWVLMKIIN